MDVEEGLTKYLLLGIIDIITEYSEKERSIIEKNHIINESNQKAKKHRFNF